MTRAATHALPAHGLALALVLGLILVLAQTALAQPEPGQDALDRIEALATEMHRLERSKAADVRELLAQRRTELERARVRAMSEASGVAFRRLTCQRAKGRTWGAIARELGQSTLVVGVATGPYGERDYARGHDRPDDDHVRAKRAVGRER